MDRQIKVVDIGQDTNVAVGVYCTATRCHRWMVPSPGLPIRIVTEVYYIVSGSVLLADNSVPV